LIDGWIDSFFFKFCCCWAGEGISLWVLGVLVTIKALGNETGGSYSLFEDVVPPGVGPPSHVHTREDETWYMLEGELEWKVGGCEVNTANE
jgi:quercetin dioxygenase-like cupin family protein